jgi:predicted neuraminidase
MLKPKFDASCNRDKAAEITASSLNSCEAAAAAKGSNVFSWNEESHHCFMVTCTEFSGQANDHVESGCIPGSLPGCAAPAPPGPGPPPPNTPAYDGVLRSQPDGTTVAYMIPPYKSNHASTIEVLPDGTLAAAWFSGAKEEAPGCAIVFARLKPNAAGWTTAATLSERDEYSNQNPVLFYDNTTATLHLFHSQAPAEAGETAAEIWHLASTDGGSSWSKPAPYFTKAGDFPRNRIIRRKDGTILFPYYSQGKGHANDAVVGISKSHSIGDPDNWDSTTVAGSDNLVQPSALRLPSDPAKLVMFFRDRRAKSIYAAASTDEGKTWTTPKATVLPNNNAGIEANSLLSGNIVMVYNPQTSGRDPIAIATSSDGGVSWPKMRLLQHGNSPNMSTSPAVAGGLKGGNEFSYPTVLQTSDGSIHVMYTYDRETIKYVKLKESWIAARE